MAKCRDCKKEKTTAVGCDYHHLKHSSGLIYKRITGSGFRHPASDRKRCPDCGIKMEGSHTHHFGCDWEECPRCHYQLLSCGCKMTPVKIKGK